MEFDDVIRRVGEFGRIQLRTAIFSGLVTMSTAMQMMVTVFMQQLPARRCTIPDLANDTFEIQGTWHQYLINQTIPVDENGEYEGCLWRSGNDSGNGSVLPCKVWVYDTSVFPRTFPTEFGLFCDSSLLINMVNVVYLAGVALGATVGGLAADYIGRKWVSFIACLIHGVGGLGAAFSPNYGTYVAFRFVVGSCQGILNSSVVVLIMEFVSPRRRLVSVCTLAMSWGIGMVLTTPVAYLIRDWRYLQLAVALPPFLYLGFWRVIPESPRWLLSRGRYAEAEDIVKWAARVNKKAIPEVDQLFNEHSLQIIPSLSPLKIFHAPRLMARTAVIICCWITVAISWYGLTLNQGSLDGDIFINAFVLSVIDIIAKASMFIINIFGRRKTFCAGMMISALSMLTTIPVHFFADRESPSTSTTFTALYTIGKMGVSGNFNLLFMWNGEFYPTGLRSFGLGLGCTFGRVAAIVSPVVMDRLGDHPVLGNTVPLILFGCMALFCALSGLYLPETAHKHLPETLEDAQNFGVKRRKNGINQNSNENTPSTFEMVS
ncbi:organic cation transporter protein-like isoform X1 [Lingula anatina]|uniref:Organic cation transporter protein-like isoform X1 n=1 Tax=Lingula anatina TaxID=7574 RepID=A0A1S3KF14_LINAN|nr:organic cation transporter protein-like isoform X1 [Lingula anatina]|eukprot:XP_013421072.1 organic cation transporter protein-like isoform X1 [Lingula anatina]